MSNQVAIIGGSMTKFGERDAWVRELLAEAGEACLDDAGVTPDDVEHVYVSNMASGEFEGQTGIMNALAHDPDSCPPTASESTRPVPVARRVSTVPGSRSLRAPAT